MTELHGYLVTLVNERTQTATKLHKATQPTLHEANPEAI